MKKSHMILLIVCSLTCYGVHAAEGDTIGDVYAEAELIVSATSKPIECTLTVESPGEHPATLTKVGELLCSNDTAGNKSVVFVENQHGFTVSTSKVTDESVESTQEYFMLVDKASRKVTAVQASVHNRSEVSGAYTQGIVSGTKVAWDLVTGTDLPAGGYLVSVRLRVFEL